MSDRLYLVPQVGDGSHADPFRAKYVHDGSFGATIAGAYHYGHDGWCLVGANLSTTDHNTLAAQPDVSALPANLDNTLTTPQVTATKTFLESANVPAGWVNTGLTWRQVLRVVCGVFTFFQRLTAIYSKDNGGTMFRLYQGGVTLETTFNSLPLAVRNALVATAQDQNISTATLSGTSTVRNMLKAMADAYIYRAITLNGLSL